LRLAAAQVVMLGVLTRGRPGGAQHEELSLQPLPQYTLPTDGVIMCCVASTASGRIFLGGADGHVYEVQYSGRDGWLHKRVAKVRWGPEGRGGGAGVCLCRELPPAAGGACLFLCRARAAAPSSSAAQVARWCGGARSALPRLRVWVLRRWRRAPSAPGEPARAPPPALA
jgi:hypothetical protein